MNWAMVLFFSLFMILYGLVNFYVGWRGWQALRYMLAAQRWASWWAWSVGFMCLSYPFGRWVPQYLPHPLGKVFIYIGSYWLAALYYLFLTFLFCDIVRRLNRQFNFLPAVLRGKFAWLIIGLIASVALLLVYGTWNAHKPVVSHYEIWSPGKSSKLQDLSIVAVSDIHLGWIVGIDRLRSMTEMINTLEPDLVLLVGDIVDEGVDLSAEKEMPAVLNALQPRFGTFAVMGNHEYISGQAETTLSYLNQNGIMVLRDQALKIQDAFYVVGRDDRFRHRIDGRSRLDLGQVMAEVDTMQLPVILLDHEPNDLQATAAAGVDLQFSGHTHLGQLFPNNYVTAAIYEQDWGYLRKGDLQLVVSSGFGTWGPPIRVGNRPEIVQVTVHFEPPTS